MYKAFNLEHLDQFDDLETIDSNLAKIEYEKYKQKNLEKLSLKNLLQESIIEKDENGKIKLDTSKIQHTFFPLKQVDIFISHSHKDLELVQKFAYYLRHIIGVDCFIDSEIWGYADDLLQEVNNEYALIKEGLYNYTDANVDAANVYMTLSNALHDMINQTDTIFFINTPQSSSLNENLKSRQVESPWIYDELKTISIIKPKIPSYISKLNVRNNVSPKNLAPNWSRPIDDQIKCLEKLDVKDLKKWKESLYTNEGLYDPAPMLAFYQIFENKK
ncbi:toll/interleukin-1 receptor domain-containing protein [Lactobacillus johnsonii]|uniref:TIR domain-containing protein n=1 Tax=Lactobacillus johnsonii TaxID=33959 RepID=A0A9X7THY5_LACJH|nr:toll/interleukin-1 receptor domain-containing protein [Lactobacillus johnsonii]QIA87668.1 hypothetical protein FEE39_04855 [Lactobacillus johnsonii]TGY31575.1 hypothetical protein E5350_00305 [Lactobacillus johnsonii]